MYKIINENTIRAIVKESLKKILFEDIKVSNIGENGPISEDSLIDPNDIDSDRDFNEERDIICMKLGRRMTDDELEQAFGDSEWFKIWKQYETAMYSSNDPSKKARGFFGFIDQMKYGKLGMAIKIFRYQDSYIMGMLKEVEIDNGETQLFYWPAYFAPSSKIQGYKMIADLCKYNNIVFTVTDDIASMLERIGLYKMQDPFYAKWRGMPCSKQLYSTNEMVTDPDVSRTISDISKRMANR